MPGNAGDAVYGLIVIAGAGLATFVVGTALPWWIAKYFVYAGGGGCALLALAYVVPRTSLPSDGKYLLRLQALVAAAAIVGIGQIIRWGLVEFIETFSAGLKARRELAT
jgi:hypothetical protein